MPGVHAIKVLVVIAGIERCVDQSQRAIPYSSYQYQDHVQLNENEPSPMPPFLTGIFILISLYITWHRGDGSSRRVGTHE